jgi:hypothetical protein
MNEQIITVETPTVRSPSCNVTVTGGSLTQCLGSTGQPNCNITISGGSELDCLGNGSTATCPNPCPIVPACPTTSLTPVIGACFTTGTTGNVVTTCPTLTSLSSQISAIGGGTVNPCNPCSLIGTPATGTISGDIDNGLNYLLSGNLGNNPACGNTGNNLCAISATLNSMASYGGVIGEDGVCHTGLSSYNHVAGLNSSNNIPACNATTYSGTFNDVFNQFVADLYANLLLPAPITPPHIYEFHS